MTRTELKLEKNNTIFWYRLYFCEWRHVICCCSFKIHRSITYKCH